MNHIDVVMLIEEYVLFLIVMQKNFQFNDSLLAFFVVCLSLLMFI